MEDQTHYGRDKSSVDFLDKDRGEREISFIAKNSGGVLKVFRKCGKSAR